MKVTIEKEFLIAIVRQGIEGVATGIMKSQPEVFTKQQIYEIIMETAAMTPLIIDEGIKRFSKEFNIDLGEDNG